ncbi:iron complex transport system substrate-binding protein [Aliiroseovarius halocynthiae]|uniref:Siderophore ABC transporter substrate-binding protein n=1 Tax=Aliiroseovarius halocynthiae TaxID=985055 RepID=A0A545SQD4_9RHOB|nr:siderophore ABC transporter substrate-binding protein [Aliiroseovarius halocynthiae]TQV67200.1 siderophore ABC transporter substrate-binding protein [Aliiroseovarius halocynthiae]SMR82068.1 iron complex transport system substrate-binding protein [Aliiroseovarius halocynthiae]
MLKKLAVAGLLIAGPAFADTVNVNTYTGAADAPVNPKNIAVFDVAAIDTLDALGVKPAGAVTNVYVTYLDDATKDAAPIGNLFEPDFEAVAALAPDLIIAGGRSSKVAPELAKIAPTIDMTIWEDTVGQGLERLGAFGKIFGKEAEATALAESFNTTLAETKEAATGKGKALIVMTNGPKVSAYGAAGRFGWLHKATGLPEAIADVEQATHGEAISFEFIADANPDILIVIDRLAAIGKEGDSAKVTLDNELVHGTNAWKDGKVIYLDPAPLYIAGGGIQSMTSTLNQIKAAFEG